MPALLFTVTGFSRILIVLGFIRTAIGTTNAPPNQVLVGIALFLTLFVMAPTFSAIKNDAIDPLEAHQISTTTAIKRAEEPLRAVHVPPDARAGHRAVRQPRARQSRRRRAPKSRPRC